jgi:signal transduction histidine kinase
MRIWRSLHLRLILSYVALSVLLLTFSGFVFSRALYSYATSVQNDHLSLYERQARGILSDAKLQNLSGDEILAMLQKDLPGIHIEMVMATPGQNLPGTFTGKILSQNGNGTFSTAQPGSFSSLPGGTSTRSNGIFVFLSRHGVGSFTMSRVTFTNGSPSATAYQFTLEPLAVAVPGNRTLSNLYRQVLDVLALALVLAVLIGWLLSRWLSRPLSSLVSATESVAGGNFQETVARSNISELDRLGEQFNQMVLRLRESFNSLAMERDTARRFAADAAHELKTPVATMRAYQDVLAEHPERLRQVAPAIGRQIERMQQVITGLLQINQLSEDSGISQQPLDLNAAVRQLEPVYQALADESSHSLTISCPQNPIQVLANQHLLELVLNNLMDNACKYTDPGGQVALTLWVDGNEALLTVQDSGRGIAPEELPCIFDRFHRGVDTQSIPGTGLGLAIVQEAVGRMGGAIAAESEMGQGSTFVIRLPLLCTC